MDKLDKIKAILETVLDNYNAELFDINLTRLSNKYVLRIIADKKNEEPDKEKHITIDECCAINKDLGDALDKEDVIQNSYLIEVSSPGLDRQLKTKKDFIKAYGKSADFYLQEKTANNIFYNGIIVSADDDYVKVKIKDENIVDIPYNNINKAKLKLNF